MQEIKAPRMERQATTPHPEHPFHNRWSPGSEVDMNDYPHSYHISIGNEMSVSVVSSEPHHESDHEGFMQRLVNLLNDPEVRSLATKYGLTIYNERDYPNA